MMHRTGEGCQDYLSYGMLQEGQVPGRGEETRRVRELRSAMKYVRVMSVENMGGL